MIVEVGFTGNRGGMTNAQKESVISLCSRLTSFYPQIRAHHGVCVGSDEQFHNIARSFGFYMVGHPGMSKEGRQHYLSKVALGTCQEIRPTKFFLDRNQDIVRESGVMIAVPSQKEEQFKGSGTWHAIRFAKKHKRPLYFVFPDGSIESECAEGVL